MLLKEWVSGLSTWSKPDAVVALEHGSRLSGHQDLYSFSKTNVRDLDDLGLAHVLYFTFLKRLTYLVSFCCLLVVPALYVCFHGDLFEREFILRFSLANFGPLYDGLAEDEEEVGSLEDLATLDFSKLDVRIIKIPGVGLNVRATDLLFYLAAFDVAACWIVFFATLVFNWSISKRVAQSKRETTAIGKYSVKFSNIPQDCSKWELVEYFDNFGTVVDMNLALPDEEIISLSRKRDVYVARLEKAVAKVQQTRGEDPEKYFQARIRRHIKKAFVLQEKVHTLSVKLKHLQSSRNQNDPHCGFITYREEFESKACIASHGLKYRLRSLYDKRDCFMGKHALRVVEAPEPDDLLRENLEYSWYSSMFRQAVVVCLMFLLILFSYLLNVAHTSTTHELSVRDMNCTNVEEVCPAAKDISPDDVQVLLEDIATQGEESSQCLDCLCEYALSQTSLISFQKYCSSKFAFASLLQTTSPYVGAFLVTLVNIVIRKLLVVLVRYEKHHTLHDQERHLFVGILAAQFVNTFVSLVIANTSTPGVADMLFPQTSVGQYMFRGKYLFLFPRWYEEVGSKIVGMILINRIMYARGVAYNNLKRKWKSLLGRRQALTQHDLNKLYEGPEFVSEAVRYGEMASLFFTALFFSGGLPLLYPALVVILLIQYWVDKYQLLKVCRKPPSQSHVLATVVAGAFPFAAILHCGFAVAAFALYPMERSPIADSAVGPYITLLVSALQDAVDRHAEVKYIKLILLQRHTILYVISLLLMLLLLALMSTRRLWSFLFTKLGELIFGSKGNQYEEDEDYDDDEELEEAAPSFDIAVTSGILEGLESYAAESNPKYALAFRKIAWMHIFQKGASQAKPSLDPETEE